MPPLIPIGALNAASPATLVSLVIAVAVTVGCVVILARLYPPKRLEERIRARRAGPDDGSTAAVGGAGAAPAHGGFDGGGFDGGGGGGGGEC